MRTNVVVSIEYSETSPIDNSDWSRGRGRSRMGKQSSHSLSRLVPLELSCDRFLPLLSLPSPSTVSILPLTPIWTPRRKGEGETPGPSGCNIVRSFPPIHPPSLGSLRDAVVIPVLSYATFLPHPSSPVISH